MSNSSCLDLNLHKQTLNRKIKLWDENIFLFSFSTAKLYYKCQQMLLKRLLSRDQILV